MNISKIRDIFKNWQSIATTQQERDRELNALDQARKGLNAIEDGTILPEHSCAIAKRQLSWLREHGEDYRQRVEIPVYEQYIKELEANS